MAELQTSHDEILKQLEASDSPLKDNTKKELQKYFDRLKTIEKTLGKDSQQYAGALTEYMNLRNKIVKEYNLILTQSESAISGMKDPNSFENKPYAQMSVEEAKKALGNLNTKFKDLPTWTYTEMVNNTVGTSFPNCENDVSSQRIARTAQEILIKKIVGENGFNSEVIAGFDNEQGNYLISIGAVENILKNESRTITSGSKEAQVNSKVIANYLKYLSNSVGGNVVAFQNAFIKNFGEKKAKELVELWNSKEDTIAKKDLETTSFGSVIENIAKIDINNIGENFLALGLLPDNDIKKLGNQITPAGSDKLIRLLNSSTAKDNKAQCLASRSILVTSIEALQISLMGGESGIKNELADSIKELLTGIHISEEEKVIIIQEIVAGIDEITKGLGSDNKAYREISGKLGILLEKTFKSRPLLSGIKIGKNIDLHKLLLLINGAKKEKSSKGLNEEVGTLESEVQRLIELLESGEITQEQFDKLAGEATEKYGSKIVKANIAQMEHQAAQKELKNYLEFKKIFDEFSPILSKRIDTLTPEVSKIILNPEITSQELKDYIGRLSLKPLLEILPQLSGTKLTYEMIDRSITSSSDCSKVIQAFPQKFSVTDAMRFNSFAFFEDPKKNGNTTLNQSTIENILSKTPEFLKKILVKNIYTLAEDGLKFKIVKEFINIGNLKIHDIPLDILKADENNDLGFIDQQKATFLKFGDTPDINKNIEELLTGDQNIITKSFVGGNSSFTNIGSINDYIEKYGIADIRPELLEKLIQKRGIGFFHPIIWIAQNDEVFAMKMMSLDASITMYLNLQKWPDRNFSEAFIKGIQNLKPLDKQKALDAYIFTSVKDIIGLYKGFQNGEKTLFLSSDVQKNIAKCLDISKHADISEEELTELRSISNTIKSFSNQSENVDIYVVDRYSKISEQNKRIFEEKVLAIIKRNGIEGPAEKELLEILKNKDWFKARIADVIKIFGSNTKNFEKFIKEITIIEIEVEEQRINSLPSLKKFENQPLGRIGSLSIKDTDGKWKIDHTKLREDYYAYLAQRSKEKKDNELPEVFNQRILIEYIASFGSSEDTSDFEEIIKSSQIIQEKTYIRDHTPDSIQAAVEGRFDTLYGSYLQSTYGLPASVIPGFANKAAPTEKPGVLPVVENGEKSYLVSPTLGEIPLSTDEAKMVKGNLEAQKKLIRAYGMICNTLKLERLWEYKDIIIKAAENVSTSFIDFNKGNDFWSPESLQKFMVLVGKSVGTFKEPVSNLMGKPFDEIKQKLLSQNGATIIKGGVEDRNGRGEIEKTFITKFDPNRDRSKTQYLLEQAFKEGQLNS